MKPSYIYSLLNIVNGKIYIGKTNSPVKRKRDHLLVSTNVFHKDFSLIHKAIHKYGPDSFQFSVIQKFDNTELANKAEQYWIEYYHTYIQKYGDTYGYNLTAGGDGMQAGTLSGIKNPKAKLTETEVIDIKTSVLPTILLARKYGVHRTIIQRIRSAKIWETIGNDVLSTKGTYPDRKGESSARSKLTWQIVAAIHKDFEMGEKVSVIARRYDTSWTNVKSILQGKTWKLI